MSRPTRAVEPLTSDVELPVLGRSPWGSLRALSDVDHEGIWIGAWSFDGAASTRAEHLLSDDERLALGPAVVPVRRAMAARRALTRAALSVVLSCSPVEVPIVRTCRRCGTAGHGRPELLDDPSVRFSASSSGALVLLAVARFDIGVDVERQEHFHCDADEILDLVTSEQDVIEEPGSRGVARLWVRKEATVKAAGTGVAEAATFSVARPDPTSQPRALHDGRIWELHDIDVGPPYAAALARPFVAASTHRLTEPLRPIWVEDDDFARIC